MRALAPEVVADSIDGLPALITVRRASEVLGVPIGTLRRWMRAGLLHPVRVCGGHPRLPRAEIARVLREAAGSA